MYRIKDFDILSGEDTGDKRIAYVFKSKDGKVSANFFFTPRNVETRGLIWKNGDIISTIHITYPFANYDGTHKLPRAEAILKTIIKRLSQPDYKSLLGVPMKKYLVKFTQHCGEYEFSGQTVLELKSRQKIKTAVHNYFLNFYEKENLESASRLDNYSYNMGEVCVNRISYDTISDTDAQVLQRLNIA
jgi:hypothetical protein